MTFLSTKEAAAKLRLSASLLNKLRITGEGPKFCKLGRRVTYLEENLTSWAIERTRTSTSQH